MDQKKLREMMKREKEKRSSEVAAAGPPGRRQPGLAAARARPGAAPVAAARTGEAAVTATAGVPSPQKDRRVGLQVATSGSTPSNVAAVEREAGDDTPAAKRARADALAMPPPPPVPAMGHRGKDAPADAVSMPPPPLPARARGAATAAARPPESTSGPAEPQSEGAVKPGPEPLQCIDRAAPVVGTPASAASVEGHAGTAPLAASLGTGEGQPQTEAGASQAEGPEAEAEASADSEDGAGKELPEGFFDDPELDAKVRGIEAPSVRNQRELEEGLKRFEREMAVEIEQSEETRHELDEEKYEQAAKEEEEFQGSLQSRLLELRKRAAAQSRQQQEERTASSTDAPAAVAANDVGKASDAAGDNSDSDIEFDWRSKGFG